MKSVMLFLAKLFANDKWQIHRAVLSALIEGGRSKTKGQNQHDLSKSKNRGKSLNRSNVTCWNCGEKGHFRMTCTKPKKKQNQKFGDDNDSVNSAEDIGDALILSVNSPVESWIMDLVHFSICL